MLNIPVRTAAARYPSLVGSAMLGFVATGRYANLEEAGRRMVRAGPGVRPVRSHAAVYDRQMGAYQAVIRRLFG